jgi:AcrR family transcriptional regulator
MIAAAAMKILREVGADKLTMRALARHLNVSAMALYHHVDNKNDLLRLVGDELLGRIELPHPESGPWRELFLYAVEASIQALLSVPGLSSVLLSSRLLPNARALALFSIHQFERAGLSRAEAQTAYAGVHQLVLGCLYTEESANFATPAGDSELARYSVVLRKHTSFQAAVTALVDHYAPDTIA